MVESIFVKKKKVIVKDTAFFEKSNCISEKSGHFIRCFPFFSVRIHFPGKKSCKKEPGFLFFFAFSGFAVDFSRFYGMILHDNLF